MSSLFSITTTTNTLRLKKQRQGEATFTVSNASGHRVSGRALLQSEDPKAANWLSLQGETERDFPKDGTERYTVKISAPEDAPEGSYPFRLDMVGVERPDEEYTRGQTVTFEVPESEPKQKPFPGWVPLVTVGVLLLGGLIAFLLVDGNRGATSSGGTVEVVQPDIWARGTTCLTPARSFDLDQGSFDGSVEGDIFYENVDGVERYLRSWRGQMAEGGNAPLHDVSFTELVNAEYGTVRFDASYGGGEVLPGTTWFVRTSEERFAKIHILRSGQFMELEWVTYAKEDDQGELAGSPIQKGNCSVEEERNCGTGQLSGDEIRGFRVLQAQPEEALLEVDLAFNADHGSVIVVPLLIDENGENISGAYRPTAAQQDTTEVPVLFNRPGRARSAELLIYMFESGSPSEAFICRRFPFSAQWGSS